MADNDKKEAKKKAKAEKKQQKKKEKENKKKKGQDGDEDDDEDEGSGKGLVIVVAILIALIWLVILGLLIKMDVGGFGSTVLYPVLKNVPVINKILPEVKEEYAKEDAQYTFATVDDAVKRIKELEAELAAAKSSGGVDSAHLAELEAQAIELKTYKDNQKKFEEDKEKFYQEVVFSDKAPDIKEYKKYYESIQPQNAEAIYKQVVQQTTQDEQIKQYASTYSSMKPAQAAGIFDTMTDNLSLVGRILWAMDASSRGKILGAMNADTAAKVTKIMEPK